MGEYVLKSYNTYHGNSQTDTIPSAVGKSGYLRYDKDTGKLWRSNGTSWYDPSASSSSLVKGTVTKSGDGTTKIFTIPHGQSSIPEYASVTAKSTDALGTIKTDVDETNIIITYPLAPPSGTNNLVYSWMVS